MRRRHDIADPADFDLLPAHPQAEHAYHAHAAGAKGNARATEGQRRVRRTGRFIARSGRHIMRHLKGFDSEQGPRVLTPVSSVRVSLSTCTFIIISFFLKSKRLRKGAVSPKRVGMRVFRFPRPQTIS